MLIHHDDCGLQLITDGRLPLGARAGGRRAAAVRDRRVLERRGRSVRLVTRTAVRASPFLLHRDGDPRASRRTVPDTGRSRERPSVDAPSGTGLARPGSRARRGPSPVDGGTADDHDGQPVRLRAAHEVRGRGGELVGDGDLRRPERQPPAVGCARGGRAAERGPRRRSRRRSFPAGTAGRRSRSRRPPRRVPNARGSQFGSGARSRPGRPGAGSRCPASAAFEWSTPADAQTNPWWVSAITRPSRERTTRPVSCRMTSSCRRSVSLARELAGAGRRLDVARARRRALRPSRRPSARRRPRRPPGARPSRRSARRARLPPGSRGAPRPG